MMRWLLPQELIQYYLIIIIYITVPVTTVTFTPSGDNNVVDIIEGPTQTFTCTTNPIRPAAWILWYIGGQNVTNQSTPNHPLQLVVWCMQGGMLITTKLCSVKLLTLRGDRKLNLQKRI
jgi:hypothetical protein